MRILVTYGRRAPYPLFGVHLVQAFRRLGHGAELLAIRDQPRWRALAKRLPQAWKPGRVRDHTAWANRRTLSAAAAYRPQAVLDIGGDVLTVETLDLLKRRWGCQRAVWLTEAPAWQEPLPAWRHYDHLASNSRIAVEELRRAGHPQAAFMPLATDPDWYRPARRGVGVGGAVGLVGQYSPWREQVLEALTGVELAVWGPNWHARARAPIVRRALRNPRRGVFGRAVVRCYQRLAVFLNIQREEAMATVGVPAAAPSTLSWRFFDAPACGALLLSDWVTEVADSFEPHTEIAMYASPEELRDKAAYLLSHERQRRAMAQRARERVLREHTCLHRARRWVQWFDSGA